MKDEKLYLIHILECVERIEGYTISGEQAFVDSTLIQDAVIRNFEIIGEAAKRISPETQQLATDIPWRRLAGFRDILIHQYQGVDVNAVWLIIQNDLPALKANIGSIIENLK